MLVKIFLADAFFAEPYSGATVTVVFLDQLGDSQTLARLAEKFSSSITAYLLNHGDDFLVRWFSPHGETSMGGQGAIAAANIIYEAGLRPLDQAILFHTQSGVFSVARDQIEPDFLRLSLAQTTLRQAPESLAAEVQSFLNPDLRLIDEVKIWQDSLLVLLLEDDAQLARLCLSMDKIASLPINGVVFCARKKDGEADYALRSFIPRLSCYEDQICCDVNSALGPYWAEKLQKKRLEAVQLSRCGGRLILEMKDSFNVDILGRSRTILKADLMFSHLLPDLHQV